MDAENFAGFSPAELTRKSVKLALLLAGTVFGFLCVGAITHAVNARHRALAHQASLRGASDLHSGNYRQALEEFDTALLYARDSDEDTLGLAEALQGMGRTEEARAYLLKLREKQPENGEVNLELARIAVHQNAAAEAERYYHSAIYAAWPDSLANMRRQARLELVDYLLRTGAQAQAQAELMALIANAGDNRQIRLQAGALFARAGDKAHALATYRQVLQSDPHDAVALAGAGAAAYELGRYEEAEQTLRLAAEAAPLDAANAERYKLAVLIEQTDPYRKRQSPAERNRRVLTAFQAAGKRLQSCIASERQSTVILSELLQQWNQLHPRVNEQSLQGNSDLADKTMTTVFAIERTVPENCAVTDVDRALLRLAHEHEEN